MQTPLNISNNFTDIKGSFDFTEGFRTFMVIYFLVVIVVGTTANIVIIFAFLKAKKLRTNVNYFLISLTCSDLIHLTVIMPLEAETLIKGEKWQHSVAACEFHLTMLLHVLSSSSMCLLLLAAYRFMTVRFPYHKQAQSPKNVKIVICLIWVYSLVTSSLPIMGWNDGPSFVAFGQCFVRLTKEWTVFFSTSNIFIPAFLTLLFYFSIYLTARQHAAAIFKNESRFPPISTEDTTEASNNIQKQRKVFKCSKTMMKITTVYLVCWMPFVLLNFIYAVTFPVAPGISRYLHSVFLLLAFSNSMLDPFLYTIWCSDFKSVICKLVERLRQYIYRV